MTERYTYSDLIDILNGMYNEEEILRKYTISWDRLQLEATNSIIEKLYNLQNDTQRVGFLNATLLRIFNDGKDYNLKLVENGVSNTDQRISEQYVYNCLLVLNGLITDISEACLQYEGIDFPKIIKDSVRTSGVELDFVMYTSKPVTTKSKINLSQASNKVQTLLSVSKNFNLDYYFNVKNVIRQDFILDTFEYFENGKGQNSFEPLAFLNLFWMQLEHFEENIHKPFTVISRLLSLPLSNSETHILIGFILEFYGGSPIQAINVQHSVTLILLERTYASLNSNVKDRGLAEPAPLQNGKQYVFTSEDFSGIIKENDLDFYFNIKNQPNSELIFETYDHFESGARKGYIEPVVFLNLLRTQYEFILLNIEKAHSVITGLKNLQITDEMRHVLLGFVLKWFGGYPIQNSNPQYQTTLKIIEKEFLKYVLDTPEREYCKKYYLRNIKADCNVDNDIVEPPLPLVECSPKDDIVTNSENIFKNNFNSIDNYELIRNHFHPLTMLKSKNGYPHLTEEQLSYFIKIAFQDLEKIEIKMNFQRGEIHTIKKIFYSFYKICEFQYESTRNVKEKYVRLLSDYFVGFEYNKVFGNFNK